MAKKLKNMRTIIYNKITYNTNISEPANVVAEPKEIYEPNEKTIEAIEEGDSLVEKYKKGVVKGYTNARDMFNDIFSDDDDE